MKPENFTSHAVVRLKERTLLNPMELNAMLCGGFCVDIGSKPGINKTHYLFYSEKDDDCFVAVLDNLDGTIITIWLVEYQESLGWDVTLSQKEEAANLAKNYAEFKAAQETPPSRYYLSVGYTTTDGKILNCLLAKVAMSDFNDNPEWSFKSLASMKKTLLERLEAKKSNVAAIHWLTIREGKKGDFTVINFED